MLLKDIEHIFYKELNVLYPKQEIKNFFFMCCESFYNISRLQLALNTEISITKEEQTPIFDALHRLKQQQPIQYILGETEFYGLPFKVNKNTLIPRPETEELVSLIINDVTSSAVEKSHSILDIGTGSGCIAISLAKNLPEVNISALDVSVKALKVAKENAVLNGVDVTFIEDSILEICHSALDAESTFDIIVSNPPYVRNLEKEQMKDNVLNNEPHLALFVEDDSPLIFYKAIIGFAVNNLKPKGTLYFEINEYLGLEMINLLEGNGFENIELIKDMFGKDRIIKGVKA